MQGFILATDDLVCDLVEVLALKRFLQHYKLVEHDSDGPHISLGVVLLAHEDFRSHEEGGAARCHGFWIAAVELARDAEVTQLVNVVLRNENVLRLNVSVENVLVVHHDDC